MNDLAVEAARRGIRVSVLTQQPSYPCGRIPKGRRNSLFSHEDWAGVEIFRIKTVLGYRESLSFKLLNYCWFAAYASIAALCLRRRFDRVLVYQTGPLTMAIPGILFSKLHRTPLAIWTQDVWPDSVYAYGFRKTPVLSHVLDVFVGWVYRSANAILISCRGFEVALGKYTDKKMTYAPNWPLSPYKPEIVPRSDVGGRPVFLFAGNVGKVQNLENLIRGYALASLTPGFWGLLRIVGDGSALEGLKSLSRDLGVDIDFVGRKPSSAMSEEYACADFLVLSLSDKPVLRLTVPSKFQMYLSVGKPILCAAEGEVREIVDQQCLGQSADAESPESIALAFITLSRATDADLGKWKDNASRLFKGSFDRDTIISSILRCTADCV